MEGVQLRDEAAQDRVRAAIEFLDPSKYHLKMGLIWMFQLTICFLIKAMHGRAGSLIKIPVRCDCSDHIN